MWEKNLDENVDHQRINNVFTQLLCIRMKLNEFIELTDYFELVFLHPCAFIYRMEAAFHIFRYGNEYQTWSSGNDHDTHYEEYKIEAHQIFDCRCDCKANHIFRVERKPIIKFEMD